MANGIQSPTPFLLSPNNDQLERAQVRAARAAANRRKAAAVTSLPSPPNDPCLSDEQVAELFHRCIKLASENKINQKNSWELKLIDHLSDIIKVEAGNDSETNFQKASCTLEAGVKIYSLRVDSVHAEAYKVLGRINRAGLEDGQETTMEDGNVSDGKDKSQCKKEVERKVSPLSTLESSFEALNLKKFDVAFVVDPLYHQTSAQFDEGGAKGLLLNNLGVYGRCQVLFDSSEIPGKCRSCRLKNKALDLIDLSFEKESIQQMVTHMLGKNEISPTLNDILCRIDKDNRRPAQAFNITQNPDLPADAFDDNEVGLDFSSGRYDTATIEHERGDDIYVSHEDVNFGTFQSHQEDNNSYTSVEADMDARFEEVSTFLLQGLAITSKKNAWAGPDHWKYWRPKGSEDAPATPSTPTNKRSKNKNNTQVELVFTTSIDKEFPDIFSPPKTLKSLLLSANRVPSHRLPEDCHYPADDLVKLFLLPSVLLLGKRRRNHIDDNSWEQRNNFDEALPSWGNLSVASDQYNDGCAHGSVEDLDTLIPQPRQVTRIEVQCDRTSKGVDLHALKKTLWDHMQEFVKGPELELKDTISFKVILSTFPINCQATMPEDISPHLCFICLLHLANEHGLSIHGFPSLDDLSIHLPSCLNSSDGVVQPSSWPKMQCIY
ncbi:putative condensin complex subunit 2/barren [Rosa chinensis]|uniref:Condensin complex subunit 2 n=1 Tax=Rosa chinensis TaxID=74649 RepID=A0A2P6QCN6_ROSCH|nr:condensin complex subunit 2 [Rosa chinensis]PRQ31947.1 putative condensin complex subunit 2/barren [Rosa chinensis]